MEKTDILSLTKAELTEHIIAMGEKRFRAEQVYDWLHVKRVKEFSQMSNISAAFRTKLEEKFCINSLKIRKRLVSELDNTVKYLYELYDGEFVESVLMEYKHGYSLCISSQVGCRMGCRFCASTIAGWVRNLAPSELLGQIYETERDSGRRVDSIVMMGIGEPLDNFDNVLRFLEILNADGEGMSLRHLSLSTCGLVDKIYKLAELKLGITLSVSLHAANDAKRSEIMPINRRFPLDTLMKACDDYFKTTGRRISFEYSLIEGVNDTDESADELISLLGGKNCHVNLIPINEIAERDFKKSRYAQRFRKRLTDGGINATIRRTLGSDINAACGQLRRDSLSKEQR